jgi:hypothetical protein
MDRLSRFFTPKHSDRKTDKKKDSENTLLLPPDENSSSHSETQGGVDGNPLQPAKTQGKHGASRKNDRAPQTPDVLKEKNPGASKKGGKAAAKPSRSRGVQKTEMSSTAKNLFGHLGVTPQRALHLCESVPELLPAIDRCNGFEMNDLRDGSFLNTDPEEVVGVLETLAEHAPDLACKLFSMLSPICASNMIFGSHARIRAFLDSPSFRSLDGLDVKAVEEAFFRGVASSQHTVKSFKHEEPMGLPNWMNACPAWASDRLIKFIKKNNPPERLERWCLELPAFKDAWTDLQQRRTEFNNEPFLELTDLDPFPVHVRLFFGALGVPMNEGQRLLKKQRGARDLATAIQPCEVTGKGLVMAGTDAHQLLTALAGDLVWEAKFVAALHPDSLMDLIARMGPHGFEASLSTWYRKDNSVELQLALTELRQSYAHLFELALGKARGATRAHRKESLQALSDLLDAAPIWLVGDLVDTLSKLDREESPRFLTLRWQTEEFSRAWTKARERAER